MSKSIENQVDIDEDALFNDVSKLIESAQQHALSQLNKANVILYWHLGKKIDHVVLQEQRG